MMNDLVRAGLDLFKEVGIQLNPQGFTNNRDFERLSEWAAQNPDYPVEWFENLREYVIAQGVTRFDRAMDMLNASAVRDVPVGWRAEAQVARQGELSEDMLTAHFDRVTELKEIEGTMDWRLAHPASKPATRRSRGAAAVASDEKERERR